MIKYKSNTGIEGDSLADVGAKFISLCTKRFDQYEYDVIVYIDGDQLAHWRANSNALMLPIDAQFIKYYIVKQTGEHSLMSVFDKGSMLVIIGTSCKPYIKSDWYPEYKGNRKELRPGILKNVIGVCDRLHGIEHEHIVTLELDGFECDDILCSCYELMDSHLDNLGMKAAHVCIASDRDYLMCFNTNSAFSIWLGERIKLDGDEFIMKMLAGDVSDNIPPLVPGLGKKTAKIIINVFDKLDATLCEVLPDNRKRIFEPLNIRLSYKRR